MKHRFALVVATLVACIALSAPLSAAQETFPSKDINLVVTYSPGGGFDSIARAIARSMTKEMPKGLNVIVKNITGAAGVRGTTSLYRVQAGRPHHRPPGRAGTDRPPVAQGQRRL